MIDSMDTRTPAKRSEIMSAVRTKDTGPELAVRRLLFTAGYRYRLHKKGLPGIPDIVFPSRKKAVFVHGCFWHGHNCSKGKLPKSRRHYWKPKIADNKKRDKRNIVELRRMRWHTLIVWQCEIRNDALLMQKLRSFVGRPNAQKRTK